MPQDAEESPDPDEVPLARVFRGLDERLSLLANQRLDAEDQDDEALVAPAASIAAPVVAPLCYNHLVVIDEALEEDWEFRLTEEEVMALGKALDGEVPIAAGSEEEEHKQADVADAAVEAESPPDSRLPDHLAFLQLDVNSGGDHNGVDDGDRIRTEASLTATSGPPTATQRQALRLLHQLLTRYDQLSENQVLESYALPVIASTPRSRSPKNSSAGMLSRQGSNSPISMFQRLSLDNRTPDAGRGECRRQMERHYTTSSVFGHGLSLSLLPLLPKLVRLFRQLLLPLDWQPSEQQQQELHRRNLDQFNQRCSPAPGLSSANGSGNDSEDSGPEEVENEEDEEERRLRHREMVERAELIADLLQSLTVIGMGAPEAVRPVLREVELLPELVGLLCYPNWNVVEQAVLTIGKLAVSSREELIQSGILPAFNQLHRRVQRAQHLGQLRERRRASEREHRRQKSRVNSQSTDGDGGEDDPLSDSSSEHDCGCELSDDESEAESDDPEHPHHLHPHPHHHHRHHSRFCLAEDEMPASMRKGMFWALSSCVRDQPFVSAEVGRRVLKLVIPEFMSSGGSDYEVHLLWALRYISEHDILGCELAACTKVVRRLLRIISKADRELTIPALQTLGELCSGDEESIQKLLDAGLLDGLLNLFDRPAFNEDRLRWKVCWIVSSVAAGDEKQCRALVKHPLLPRIARLLNEGGTAHVQRELFTIFHNLLEGEERTSRMAFLRTDGPLFTQLIIFVHSHLDQAYREHEYPPLLLESLELLAQAAEQLHLSGRFFLTPAMLELATVLERVSKDRDLDSDALDDIEAVMEAVRSLRDDSGDDDDQ